MKFSFSGGLSQICIYSHLTVLMPVMSGTDLLRQTFLCASCSRVADRAQLAQ